MARASSVILTPAEKKLAVNNAKDSAKAAKAKHAGLIKDRAALDKGHAAKLKELEKVMTVWQRRQCQEIKRKKWR